MRTKRTTKMAIKPGRYITPRDGLPDTMKAFVTDRLLDREGERLLFTRLAAGDETAQEEIVRANGRLVAGLAARHAGAVSFEELFAAGLGGLLRATERFDLDRGFKFSTYAVWWIRQAIVRCVANTARTIRVPGYIQTDADKAEKVGAVLYQRMNLDHGRDPTHGELLQAIADEYSVALDKARKMLESEPQDAISLNSPVRAVDAPEDATVFDTIADPEAGRVLAKLEARDHLEQILNASDLTAREIAIIRMRNGIDGESMTLEAIGKLFAVTKERIRQIEQKAMKTLRARAKLNGGREDY